MLLLNAVSKNLKEHSFWQTQLLQSQMLRYAQHDNINDAAILCSRYYKLIMK